MNDTGTTKITQSSLAGKMGRNTAAWAMAAVIVAILLSGGLIWLHESQQTHRDEIRAGIKPIMDFRVNLTQGVMFMLQVPAPRDNIDRGKGLTLMDQARSSLDEGLRSLQYSFAGRGPPAKWSAFMKEMEMLRDRTVRLYELTLRFPSDKAVNRQIILDEYSAINRHAELLDSRMRSTLVSFREQQDRIFTVMFVISVLLLTLVGTGVHLGGLIQSRLEKDLDRYRLHLEELVEQRSAALSESEARLRAFLETFPDVAFVIDQEGRYVEVLTSVPELLYKPEEQLKGRFLSDIFPAADADRFLHVVQEAISSGKIQTIEYRLSMPGGSKWFEGRCVPVVSRSGSQDLAIFVARDITQKKRSEELEAVQNGITRIIAEASSITYALPRILKNVCTMLGWDLGEVWSIDYSSGSLHCRCMWSIAGLQMASYEEHTQAIAFARGVGLPGRVWDSGQVEWVPDVTRDPKFLRAASAEKAGLHTAFAVPIVLNREVTGVMVFFHHEVLGQEDDLIQTISGLGSQIGQFIERTEAKEQLKKAKTEAEAASLAKSAFLANMSHEIRTPMNAILGFAQLLRRDPLLTPRQRKDIETINRNGKHLLALINDILEMSRIEAGRIVLRPADFSLKDLLADLELTFHPQAESKGLYLTFEQEAGMPEFIHADEHRLRQIFINLVGNAVKFTDQGGVSVRVHGEVTYDPELVRIVVNVEDTGPGIPEKDRQRIFQAFEQAGTAGRTAGTGLGLPISRELVHLMGGEITVTGAPGGGSCFRFDVAVQRVREGVGEKKVKAGRIVGLKAMEPVRLLVVDDNPDSRELLCALLRPIGFEVDEAEDGREAIDLFTRHPYHAVLMDVRMPGMDGYEATQRLKATEAGKTTPIIAVTASAFGDEEDRVKGAGADAYIRKPFIEEEVLAILGQYLGLQYVHEEQGEQEGAARQPLPREITPEALAALPKEWITAMRESLEEGDMNRLSELINQVQTFDQDMASKLQALADQYDYGRLGELLGKE
ncbi:MAG: Autoinducer 2 sensor kinase/phosphatase LuxQ [Syntrophorhabdus sp. PtaU1.Bin058]|nr:MAG: Autoinducer 2 sensor kinase/phosphatase LuxQ [Syntrophorhabdus sp. PtaU1.Bin058]